MKKHILSVAVLALVVTLTTFTSCRKPKAEDTTPAKEGLYLGIVGFNSELYTMPLGLLNQDTKHNFENFVDGLSMQNGTILYHAVNTGLNSLPTASTKAHTGFPKPTTRAANTWLPSIQESTTNSLEAIIYRPTPSVCAAQM